MTDQEKLEFGTDLIGAVESGGHVFGKRNFAAYAGPAANTPNEVTCTLGWAQFYGTEANRLINNIYNADPSAFAVIDSEGLIKAKLGVNWVTTKWNPTAKEKAVLIALISSDVGKKEQDKLFQESFQNCLKAALSYDSTMPFPAQLMWAEIQHLGGEKCCRERIFPRAKRPLTPDSILASLMLDQNDSSSDNQVGDKRYQSRHEFCVKTINTYFKEEKTMEVIKSVEDAILWFLAILNAELGYLEKASSSNLQDKKANAGSKNYTKYWLLCPKYQALAWCAMFLHWCMADAFSPANAVKLLKTSNMTGGTYIDPDELSFLTTCKTPSVGAIVMFHNGKEYGHTGAVVEVTSTGIYTIEGNTSPGSSEKVSDPANGGGVYRKFHSFASLSSKTKYFMPNYALVVGIEKKRYIEGCTDVSTLTSAVAPVTTKKVNDKYVITASSLNVRAGQGTSYSILCAVKNGTEVIVTEESSNNWGKITVDGKTGWISLGYAKKVGTVESEPVKEESKTPEAAPAAVPYKELTVKKGMTGKTVKALQILLIGLGYSCGSYGADGEFGSGTLSGVNKFKQSS